MVTGYGLHFATSPGWVSPVFQVGTYLLVGILLVWESNSLPDYHINPLAIWMMILFKPIETILLTQWPQLNSPLVFPRIPSLFIWIIALGLLVHFRSQLFLKGTVRWADLKWALLGGLAGLGVVLITSYPMSFSINQIDSRSRTSVISTLSNGFVAILYQIGYAAVSVEPVFRGFLWGILRKIGWRDVWIWLFQAGLFSLAYLYYINTSPLSFWFVIPFGALVMGWLVWRSRSIATSMIAHGVWNGLTPVMDYLIAATRL